jgi:hypothetical protein
MADSMPPTSSPPAATSPDAHLDRALELVCATLVALDTISLSVHATVPDVRDVDAVALDAADHLRQAASELRAARDEGRNVLIAGFVLARAPRAGRPAGTRRQPRPRRTA